MEVDLLPDAGGIEADWWDLWYRDPAATPFQSPAWLLPWRRHFPAGESAVLTLREKGRLLALLPLYEHEGRLLPWGAGPTDWLDGVFDPDLDSEMLSNAVERLSLPLELFQLRPDSPLLRMRVPDGWREHAGLAESCAILPLTAPPSSKMAHKLRYYSRRAERAGIAGPDRASASEIETLADLHTRRWRRRDQPGIFADPRMLDWQREALAALEAAGLLRLYVLRARDQPVAALCVLGAKQRSFYYIGGFDPSHARLGLGTILVGHAIEEAQREGHHSFDFLRGREPYKYRWGASDRPTHARRLLPPHWRAA